MHFRPFVSQRGHEPTVKRIIWFSTIEMAEFNHFLFADVHLSFGETIVFGIGLETIQLALDIVADDVKLIEACPECFCCLGVIDITKTINVRILFVSESGSIDV